MNVWGWVVGVCCSVAWSCRGEPAAAVVLRVNEKLLGSKNRGKRETKTKRGSYCGQ